MIEKVVLLSFLTFGICCTMWEGMVFEKFGHWIESKVGEFWAKPLGKCFICTTFWVSLITCLIVGWPWYLCVPAMGLSAIISLLQHE